jgi:hypothetical protein
MQHQLTTNNEQSAHRHTQDLHPKSPGMGDAGHMSQSTYGSIEYSHFLGSFFGFFLYKIGNWTSTGVRHCVE